MRSWEQRLGTAPTSAMCTGIASVVAAILLLPMTASATFVAVGFSPFNSEVYSIDENDGAISPIGFSGIGGFNSLTVDDAGVFWSATDRLIEINPRTGLGTEGVLLDFGGTNISIRGLAFSPFHGLFAINFGGVGDTALFSIDPSTGKGTRVRRFGGFIQALEFAPNGDLYGWDRDNGLFTLNPLTGARVNISRVEAPFLQSIAFTPDGRLFGALGGSFHEIDRTNGQVLRSYRNLSDTRGLAYVPEPGSGLLLGLGLAGLARGSRGRAR